MGPVPLNLRSKGCRVRMGLCTGVRGPKSTSATSWAHSQAVACLILRRGGLGGGCPPLPTQAWSSHWPVAC